MNKKRRWITASSTERQEENTQRQQQHMTTTSLMAGNRSFRVHRKTQRRHAHSSRKKEMQFMNLMKTNNSHLTGALYTASYKHFFAFLLLLSFLKMMWYHLSPFPRTVAQESLHGLIRFFSFHFNLKRRRIRNRKETESSSSFFFFQLGYKLYGNKLYFWWCNSTSGWMRHHPPFFFLRRLARGGLYIWSNLPRPFILFFISRVNKNKNSWLYIILLKCHTIPSFPTFSPFFFARRNENWPDVQSISLSLNVFSW